MIRFLKKTESDPIWLLQKNSQIAKKHSYLIFLNLVMVD